ncbi:uncharacterized protein F4812DRAFT_197760 [Daldinia caldariorum]|uniref:uncharacterized protein n=1 Tax=Daldinia caldariorum TaxID=326644 RepID=UPI0020076A0A|nr:uncharacterized protein F4812DRAFT_197760 [Daldinia caldariorum]KAI1471887.1 hypothetical protein F4812DRAFT_197760 [Daldinia caldariorum]
MPALDIDSQFKFLIMCIKHSTAGKVDFTEVAKECEIVSKGAAAKRYERLLRAHGISATGGGGGVKKESKDSKDGVKTRTPSKKRKLAAIDEYAGDEDEPIKTEIKGEVKTEDSIAVKAEQENGGGGATAIVAGVPTSASEVAPADQPNTSLSTDAQNNDEDDDVLVISATERCDDNGVPVYGSSGHHHSHAHLHSHSTAPIVPGIHSFDYAANMAFPQQMAMTTPTRVNTTHNSLPYGFPPGTWMFPHDAHSYL